MLATHWINYLKVHADSALILGLALIVIFAFMAYRIVMQGMRSGKEMRLGSWFWWKK
jgi:F0F1-type ATP synthase membrane subunit a